jgi:RecJ-like exonuclease
MNVDRTFTYHRPTNDQQLRYARLRRAFHELAQLVERLAPESAERTLALRALHLSSMHANSSIAVNEFDADELAHQFQPGAVGRYCQTCGMTEANHKG